MIGGAMTRLPVLGPVALMLCVACSAPAYAQTRTSASGTLDRVLAAGVSQGDLHGTVLDDRGKPLGGAVVSAVGATSAFAVSENDGTFAFRNLPAGPYLLRAHLQGYVPTRGRIVQVNAATKNVSAISLSHKGETTDEPQILEAGVGASATSGEAPAPESETHDHGEVAWRLRHAKRSVLKDADLGALVGDDSGTFEPLRGAETVVASAMHSATDWLGDLALNGQINLLTRTSFDRPQDLLSLDVDTPRGVTYLALSAPTVGGDWSMRGAMTQGDLASWILSGAYTRKGPVAHRYEAGMSYGVQTYRGGNAAALAAISDTARRVGAVHAYDNWTVSPRVDVSYGAKYARYDYLADRGLLSPRATLTYTADPKSGFRVRASAARRELAPGADEFLPPATALWLPPERTFSPLTPGEPLRSERVDHVEFGAERQVMGNVLVGVRAFHEAVDNQIVTLFGVSLPDTADSNLGHYYVASGGAFDATGWGVSLQRAFLEDRVHASVDYTLTNAEWLGGSADRARLALAAASALRADPERVHDVTTSIESDLSTATRVLVVYKLNSGFASSDGSSRALSSRFEMQVNQALPFLNFANAQWEMLIAVRNLFSDDFREGSVYDELLVVRPPKRLVGGVTVRF
jgi:hypothetical protein